MYLPLLVSDLLPHLSHDVQDIKKLEDAIKGESLDIVIGSMPATGDVKDKIKAAILDKLHKDYGDRCRGFALECPVYRNLPAHIRL